MRRTTHVLACLAVAATGFAVADRAPAETGPERIEFRVANPAEFGAERTVVGHHYQPDCDASTVVLLQHGLSYHKEAWDWPGYSVAQHLVDAGYAVVAIDRLGYGESHLDDGYRVAFEAYGDMADQIVGQLRDRYDNVAMGGHSAGGGVTQYAQGVYGSADAIMVLGWHHRPSDEIVYTFMTDDTVRTFQDDFVYFLGTPEYRADMFYEANADPEVVAADNAAANLTPSGEVQTISKQPSRYVAADVGVPVFIQLSENDRIFEVEYAGMYAGEFLSSPSVTVDLVPVAGHTFMLAPEGPAAAERMAAWLTSRPETPSCR